MPDSSINSPRPRKVYREAEKVRFREVSERLGKVSLAAREVGVHPARCYQWPFDAGIDARKRGRARRAEYFRLRESGVARADAARQTGLSLRTAIDWDQGIQHASNRRVHPNGRVLDYNKEVPVLRDTRQRLLLPSWRGSWIRDICRCATGRGSATSLPPEHRSARSRRRCCGRRRRSAGSYAATKQTPALTSPMPPTARPLGAGPTRRP